MTTVFIISISKIIHQISTLLTLLNPEFGHDPLKKHSLDDNVSFDGLSIHKYHTISVVDDEIIAEIGKLNAMDIDSLTSLEMPSVYTRQLYPILLIGQNTVKAILTCAG